MRLARPRVAVHPSGQSVSVRRTCGPDAPSARLPMRFALPGTAPQDNDEQSLGGGGHRSQVPPAATIQAARPPNPPDRQIRRPRNRSSIVDRAGAQRAGSRKLAVGRAAAGSLCCLGSSRLPPPWKADRLSKVAGKKVPLTFLPESRTVIGDAATAVLAKTAAERLVHFNTTRMKPNE